MATTAEAVAADIVTGLRKGSHTVWSPAKLAPVFTVLKLLPRPIWRARVPCSRLSRWEMTIRLSPCARYLRKLVV